MVGKQRIATRGAKIALSPRPSASIEAKMEICTREELIEQMLSVWSAMARTETRRPSWSPQRIDTAVARQRLQLAEAAYRAGLPLAIRSNGSAR